MKSRFSEVVGVLCCMALLFSATPILAKVFYVTPEGDDGWDGSSWLTAKRTISAALSAASEGDQIWVKHGVYTERIVLKGGAELYGGFAGVETSLSQRPAFPRPSPDPYETIIDGSNEGSVVVSPVEAAASHRLDGFTIRNGLADYGGGVFILSPENALTIAYCTITNNRARQIGGGVCCFNSSTASSPSFLCCTIRENTSDSIAGGLYAEGSVSLQGCLITDNFAAQRGGGLYFSFPRPILDSCIIARNRAGYGGGGIYCINAVFVAGNCTIQNNEAGEFGGGILAIWSSPRLSECLVEGNRAQLWGGGGAYLSGFYGRWERCRIANNTAWIGGGISMTGGGGNFSECLIEANTAEYGGGVYAHFSAATFTRCAITRNSANLTCGGISLNSISTVRLDGCVVSENKATWAGGIFVYEDSTPVITGCTIARNQAVYGGGLYHYRNHFDYVPVVSNSVFFANTADQGGAVVYDDSVGNMINCTIADNLALTEGGAIWANSAYRVINTLIAYNSSGIYHADSSSPSEFRHNCAWGNSQYNYGGGMADPTGTEGNISLPPKLAAAHLLPDSPCIDAGDSTAIGGIDKDYDGEERVVGSTVDIGADEFSAPIVQGQILFNDYAGSLPLFVDMQVRHLGGVSNRSVLVDTNGLFVLPGAPNEAFTLSLKPARFLRRSIPVDTSAGSVTDVEIELTNGDIDGDNEVSLFDFGALVTAFGSVPGDPNWNPNSDLDGDEEVTLFDFGILVRNFGKVGDE